MITTLYNEIDQYCCGWLSNLMDAGLITPGKIDDRPIQELSSDDVAKYQRVHFFAGIAGWEIALNLAGWPHERPVWTGSCPCQPFSTAGKQKGNKDERHLWPVWFNLIQECRPSVIFGEQVAAAITKGWLDSVYDDLESAGYTCGAAVLPACSVGKPHKRDRLWFVGNSKHDGYASRSITRSNQETILHDQEGKNSASQFAGTSEVIDVAESFCWIRCPDGRNRPVKPGICLLANGVPARVGQIRAYGNAIVPHVGAEFIKATM